jgi:hypothetical protein
MFGALDDAICASLADETPSRRSARWAMRR